jgi:hypothetical protein
MDYMVQIIIIRRDSITNFKKKVKIKNNSLELIQLGFD